MDIPMTVGSALGSCCGCMVLVELIVKQDAGSMNLMTFATFLFITLHGFIFQTKFLTVRNKIPIKGYLKTVLLFFIVNVINNQALNFHVPIPLHIIFRSGSLLANMLLGMWLLQRRYSRQKYVSVVLVTIGIIICTLATSGTPDKDGDGSHDTVSATQYMEWLIGIGMLWFALFFSALLGVTQEQMYAAYGKFPGEALFYCHALAMPAFVFMGKDIYRHALIFTQSDSFVVPILNAHVPWLWFVLFLCIIAQYFCIKSIYKLTAECSSLTVTLVVTLRKFISLIISIMYFKNPFTTYHWIGTALVFGATLMFADIIGQVKRAVGSHSKKE